MPTVLMEPKFAVFTDSIHIAGFFGLVDGAECSVMFQGCDNEGGADELDLEMDTYCTVADPGQMTEYGRLREVTRTERRITFQYDRERCHVLPFESGTLIVELENMQGDIDQFWVLLKDIVQSGRAGEHPKFS